MEDAAIIEALNNRIQHNLDEVRDATMWENIWSTIKAVFGIGRLGAEWGQDAMSYHREIAQLNRAEDVQKQLAKLRKKRK